MRFDLPLFDDPPPVPTHGAGGLLSIPVADIEEDPAQPRLEFDDEPLKELAATIGERGVRSPISVRPHPKDSGRWMLNFGARRLRATKLAGLKEIPAFVDKAADSYDQVIENEQREGLKPLELALFVKGELEKGVSQAEIARRLGKSQTYMTFVRAMIDPPAWLMDVYRSGRCRNAAQLYELRRLHEADPERVEQRLSGFGRIGSGDVDRLKGDGAGEGQSTKERSPRGSAEVESPSLGQPVSRERPAVVQQDAQEILVLTASYQGTRVRVQLSALPSMKSAVFVDGLVTGKRFEANIDALSKLELARAE
ncbi:MAG: ParB/RepB/Spo0J family partition protein [Caldimonas sp.]